MSSRLEISSNCMDIASWIYDSSYILVSPTESDERGRVDSTYVTVAENTAVEFMITTPVPSEPDSGAYDIIQSLWSVLTLEFTGALGSVAIKILAFSFLPSADS